MNVVQLDRSGGAIAVLFNDRACRPLRPRRSRAAVLVAARGLNVQIPVRGKAGYAHDFKLILLHTRYIGRSGAASPVVILGHEQVSVIVA